MKNNRSYFQKCLLKPESHFDQPRSVAEDSKLANEQKIKILLAWRFDTEEIAPNQAFSDSLAQLDAIFKIDATITRILHDRSN